MNITTMAIERNAALLNAIIQNPGNYANWGVQGQGWICFPGSVTQLNDTNAGVVVESPAADLFVETTTGSSFVIGDDKDRATFEHDGLKLSVIPITPALIYELTDHHYAWAKPKPIGSDKPSFGWGNRTQFSTQAVLASAGAYESADAVNQVTAQNSIRENQILERFLGMKIVMTDALLGKIKVGFRGLTGSDADHLKSEAELDEAIGAGFTGFTLDPSGILSQTPGVVIDGTEQTIDVLADSPQLDEMYAAACERNAIATDYIQRSTTLLEGAFAWISCGDGKRDAALIKAVAVKYSDSWSFMARCYNHIADSLGSKDFDFESSFDETAYRTQYLSHLLTAMEVTNRGAKITRFAVKYVGRFEKTTLWLAPDGQDEQAFKEDYANHQKIADHFGYLQSVHSGSGKYNIYEYCPKMHLKTSGDISRPLMVALAEHNFPVFCSLYKAMVNSAIDTKQLYGHVSSKSNDFPSLLNEDVAALGQSEVVNRLQDDVVWRTFSHYAYGMFHQAAGTFRELVYNHRDTCAQNIVDVVHQHRNPAFQAHGLQTSSTAPELKTQQG
jgi:hypothetical protein